MYPRLPASLYLLLFSPLLPVVQPVPVPPPAQRCPIYAHYATERHDGQVDVSTGKHQLPFQRPSTECRTYYSHEVENAIKRLKPKIKDPDLFRLFENAFPNTLDTAVRWKGFAWENGTEGTFTDEDLAFVITGDM
jgi:hypothetical protein